MEQISISERIKRMAASQTLAMSQKSSELRASGVDIINLSVGEPDFNTPEHIKEAAKKAVDDNFTHYPPVPGYMELREAIAGKLRRENGLEYTAQQIVVSGGAKHSLSNVILATVNPGDEVIIPVPAWVSYIEMVKLADGVSVLVPAGIEQDFKITPEQLEDAITPRTRMILFCSPSNPSGSVYSREELRGIVDVLARHPEITVLSDEIYEHIDYAGSFISLGSFSEIAGRTVIVNGVSKAYAMTGWRIGFMAGSVEIAKAVTKLQGQTTSGVSTIAQRAAIAAYEGSQECVAGMLEAFRRRRDIVVGMAREIPGLKVNEPHGAFYLFPEVSSYFGKRFGDRIIADDNDLCMYLLEEAHVATVSGSAFCLPGYIRLSYAAADEVLVEAMKRISAALGKLV